MPLIAPIILKLEKSLKNNLAYKLFSSFKIDRGMNFLSKQVAWEG